MESLGLRFKRNELSFKNNSARGLNCKEDRLLKSALGSIEKERQRSLNAIVNEVHNIHDCLKETINVQSKEVSPTIDNKSKKQVACSRSREELNCMNNNYLNSKAERKDESVVNSDHHGNPNFPSIKQKISDPVPAVKRILSRRRNISTGSIPSDSYYDDSPVSRRSQGSPLATRSRLGDSSSNHNAESLSYLACESAKNGLQSTKTCQLTPESVRLKAQDGNESTSYLPHEIAKQGRQSTSSVSCRATSKLSNESTGYVSSEPAKLGGQLSTSVGFLNRSTESLDGNVDQVKVFHRRNAWMKRTISADNISVVIQSDKPARRITCASYGMSPVNVSSPARQRKCATSAESSPFLLRRAVERNSHANSSSPPFAGHKRVTRMVSCPQIGLSNLENEFQTLKSSDALPILKNKTELPELVRDNHVGEFAHAYESNTVAMSVSPKNNEGTYMDKNLQHRINSFLESLPGKDTEQVYDEQ